MVAPSMAGLTVAYDSGSEEEDDDDINDSDLFGDSEDPVSSDDYEWVHIWASFCLIIIPGADTIVVCYSAITGMEGVLLLWQEQA